MRSERGSVSVVIAAMVAVALVCCLGIADLGQVFRARARARAAADAAALAAAQELAIPSGAEPASLASAYAEANGGRLTSCVCAPGSREAQVTVDVVAGLLLLPDPVTVTARARAVVDVPQAAGAG